MELARREFLKESMATLGFLALPGGLFAAPSGWKAKKKPNLVFGILSDTHLQSGWDGVTPHGGFPLTVDIPISELPAGKKLTIVVRPVSSLGTKGKAIGTVFKG